MTRLGEVRLAHALVPFLRILLGRTIARYLCNQMVGEAWVFVREVFDPEIKQVCKRGFILLPGGCRWDGCTFCPYKSAVEQYVGKEPVTAEEFRLLFDIAFPLICDCEVVEIWTGGSFFWEIPKEAQEYILIKIGKAKIVRKLRVESLPAFISEDRIRKTMAYIAGKKLDVAIGFETQSDALRQRLGKLRVMKKAQYVKAIDTLKRLGARSSTYVMLKPATMTESEAIEEAVKTLNYVFEVGTDEALLQVAFVADGAPLKNEWLRGEYSPPSLWSVLAVLQASKGFGPVCLGEFQDAPPPVAGPTSCTHCNPTLLNYFTEYRRTMTLKSIARCGCADA